jgi:dipeptidyl aminopeptidase/acylaminoacyl peptidase
MNRRSSFLAVAVLLIAAPLAAQKPAKPKPVAHDAVRTPVEKAIQAMFGVRQFEQAEISPDGKRVAWVESLPGPGGAPSVNSAIFVADVAASGSPHRITAGDGKAAHAEGSLAWSPDSKRAVFLSDAAKTGQLQLYVAGANGGAARQLTHLKGNLAAPAWSPDGKTIALLFIENAPRSAGPLEAETPDAGVVESQIYEQRLALVDAATGRTRQISPADLYVYDFDWSPDGKQLTGTAAHGDGDDNWYVAELYLFDPATGATKSILKPGIQIAEPRWSPDGKTIAYVGGLMSDEPIPGGDIFTISSAGGTIQNITEGMKATANFLLWLPDSRGILFCGIDDGESEIARVDISSGVLDPLWHGPETVSPSRLGLGFSLARDGKTSAAVRQSYAHPPEVWAGPTGAWKQMTHANASLKPAWGEAKSLHWTTDIGSLQGWLVYPAHFDPSKRYPLVVCVHGGPSWATLPGWPTRWSFTAALPAAGYFVLYPNPRGSYGHGEAFTRAIVQDFGGGDFRDIMAGVDEAVKTLPIDENRIGITGWSYGGYMTMWAVTQTNRFHAAVAGAGLSNWLSYAGENKIDQWLVPFFGATVYDDPAVYAKSAPINFVKNVKAPTLIVVGDRDGECPAPQSYEFWHALKTLGVRTQFVVYPNEGHMFSKPAHSRDVIERAVAWFDKHLQ